jgi:hypothetical protein
MTERRAPVGQFKGYTICDRVKAWEQTELMAQSRRALSVSPAGHGSIPKMRTLLFPWLLTRGRDMT